MHWINSFNYTSCALVSSEKDLLDGLAIYEIAENVGVGLEGSRKYGNADYDKDDDGTGSIAFGEVALTGIGRIRAVLISMSTSVGGWENMPLSLRDADAAKRIILGITGKAKVMNDASITHPTKPLIDLIDYLRVLHANKENGVHPSKSMDNSNVQDRMSSPRIRISESVRKKQAAIRSAVSSPMPAVIKENISTKLEHYNGNNSPRSSMNSRIDRDSDNIRASFPLRTAYEGKKKTSQILAHTSYLDKKSDASKSASIELLHGSSSPRSVKAEVQSPTTLGNDQVASSTDIIQSNMEILNAHQDIDKSLQNLYEIQFPVPLRGERIRIYDWLVNLGVHVPEESIDNSMLSSDSADLETKHAYDINANDYGIYSDDMRNGIVLSELAAVLVRTTGQSRLLVKQVAAFDQFGRSMRPRLFIAGTETHVTKRIQAVRNLQISLAAMRDNCDPPHALRDLAPNPLAVFECRISIWSVIKIIYNRFGRWLLNASVAAKSNRIKARSVSPPVADLTMDSMNKPEGNPSPDKRGRGRKGLLHQSRSLSPQTRFGGKDVRFSESTHNLDQKPIITRSTAPKSIDISSSLKLLQAAASQKKAVPGGWDDTITDLTRFRCVFPEDQGLSDIDEIQTTNADVDNVKKRESKKERKAAREYLLKVRRNTNLMKQREAMRDQLQQYAQDTVSGDTTNTSNNHKNERKDGVHDAPNTATGNKIVTRNAHLADIKRAARYSQLGLSKLRVLQEESVMWMPPMGDPSKIEALSKVPLLRVTARQMVTIREWMLSLGLSILDGEGGFFFWDAGKGMAVHTYTAPPLSLGLDRLRNGQLLCALLHVLEPDAADHASLARLTHKSMGSNGSFASVVTQQDSRSGHIKKSSAWSVESKNVCSHISVAHAIENVSRVLWILKLRRCPPIPEHLLVRAEDIVRGNKDVLWGLLWEILQAYPYSNDWATAGSSTSHYQDATSVYSNDIVPSHESANQNNVPPGCVGFRKNGHDIPASVADLSTFPTLSYSSSDRRKLDQSLVKYVYSLNLIRWNPDSESDKVFARTTKNDSDIITHHTLGIPKSLSALETCFRDGTLFCALGEKVLGLGSVTTSRQGMTASNTEGHGFEPFSWNSSPHTYQQCLNNIIKVVVSLRNMATGLHSIYNMGSRFLYTGCEEAIIRGDWDTILGLMEDMRRCADKVPQRPTVRNAAHPAEKPYFGPDGSYTNVDAQDMRANIHRVKGLYDNAHYLPNRQYETKSVRLPDSTDIRPDMISSKVDDNGKMGVSGYTKMRPPAKLSLNTGLKWRGEEMYGISGNNAHGVDLLPHPSDPTNDDINDNDQTKDSLDAMYDNDEHGRKVKNPNTGIDIATDVVEVDIKDPYSAEIAIQDKNAELVAAAAANIYPNDNEREASAIRQRTSLPLQIPSKENEEWKWSKINKPFNISEFSSSSRLLDSASQSPPLTPRRGRSINRQLSNVTVSSISPKSRNNLKLSPSRNQYSTTFGAENRRSLSPPNRGLSEAVLHKSFHLSPTPLTPLPQTTIKKVPAAGSGNATDFSTHIYSTKGHDYDEEESNLGESPSDPDQACEPQMVDLISADPRTRATMVRNNEAYIKERPLNNEYNYRSKVNPQYPSAETPETQKGSKFNIPVESASKQFLAIPSAHISPERQASMSPQRFKNKSRNPVTSESVSAKSSEFKVRTSYEVGFIDKKTGNTLSHNKSPEASSSRTMILSNAGRSIRSKVSDIIDRSRLEKAHSIVRWLQAIGVLGHDIRMVRAGSNDLYHPSAAEILSTFYDGVLLCRTIERLEYSSSLPGTVTDPKSSAQRMQNIRRALDKLCHCQNVILPSQLMCAEEISEGKVDVILQLLLRLRKAYKGHKALKQKHS